MGDVELELFREPAEDGAVEAPGPKVVAVAGAKGGVGKSLLAANLSVYLATLGRKVVVVDADEGGATLHSFFGASHPAGIQPYEPPVPAFFSSDEDDLGYEDEDAPPEPEPVPPPEEPTTNEPVALPVPGLKLLHAGVDEPARGERRRARRGRLLERLTALQADFVVVDLGSGTPRSLLDLWLDADLRVFVTLPEPTAIEGTYRFLRAAFARALVRSTEGEERRELVQALRAQQNTPAPLDLARHLEEEQSPLAWRVREMMGRFELPLVVNQTRLRIDLELGDWVRTAVRRRFGVAIDYLGYIDADDTVWNTLRTGRPLLVESPGSKASRSIEKVARRLLAKDAGKIRRSTSPNVPPNSHHDLLEVDRGATDEEIRRASKRVREVFAPGSLACYGLFEETGLERLRARLEEAHDVLLDPSRRRPYELSVFPAVVDDGPAVAEDEDSGPMPPAPVITPETDFTGGLLRAVRESRGVKLREISRRTKIGTPFLQAIEEDDFGALPAQVYVRGFVAELAKFLDLDPDHVSRTYIRRYRRWLTERGKL